MPLLPCRRATALAMPCVQDCGGAEVIGACLARCWMARVWRRGCGRRAHQSVYFVHVCWLPFPGKLSSTCSGTQEGDREVFNTRSAQPNLAMEKNIHTQSFPYWLGGDSHTCSPMEATRKHTAKKPSTAPGSRGDVSLSTRYR